MAETEFTQSVAIVDPKTGLPTSTFLQKINSFLRGLNTVGDELDGVADGVADEASDTEIRSASGDDYVSARRLESASAAVALTETSGAVAIDWDTFIYGTVTVDQDTVISNPTNGQPGTWRTFLIQGNDGTDRTITFGNQFGTGKPTITDCDSTKKYLIGIFCKTTTQFLATAIDGSDA